MTMVVLLQIMVTFSKQRLSRFQSMWLLYTSSPTCTYSTLQTMVAH